MTDPHVYETWFGKEQAKRCVETLKGNGFSAYYADTPDEAVEMVLREIPVESAVGVGGSVTVREIGLLKAMKTHGHIVYDHWDPTLDQDEKEHVRNSQLVSHVFVSSTNAVTKDGALVNVDGTGNRVAAMIFGPKITIVVAGYNKIVQDIPDALRRIRNYIAPINFKRLNVDTPCQEGDGCETCKKPIACRVTTIIQSPPSGKSKFVVILVGEKLGY